MKKLIIVFGATMILFAFVAKLYEFGYDHAKRSITNSWNKVAGSKNNVRLK